VEPKVSIKAAEESFIHTLDALVHALGTYSKGAHELSKDMILAKIEIIRELGFAISAARSGQWETFGDHMGQISISATNALLDGVPGLVASLVDTAGTMNSAYGGQQFSFDGLFEEGLHVIQDTIEKTAFKLIHPESVPDVSVSTPDADDAEAHEGKESGPKHHADHVLESIDRKSLSSPTSSSGTSFPDQSTTFAPVFIGLPADQSTIFAPVVITLPPGEKADAVQMIISPAESLAGSPDGSDNVSDDIPESSISDTPSSDTPDIDLLSTPLPFVSLEGADIQNFISDSGPGMAMGVDPPADSTWTPLGDSQDVFVYSDVVTGGAGGFEDQAAPGSDLQIGPSDFGSDLGLLHDAGAHGLGGFDQGADSGLIAMHDGSGADAGFITDNNSGDGFAA
jgi:hypothetical protein